MPALLESRTTAGSIDSFRKVNFRALPATLNHTRDQVPDVLPPGFRLIPLSHGKFALVDDVDYERVAQFKWTARQNRRSWYAVRRGRDGEPSQVSMHRFIVGAAQGVLLDHRNHDGLDNRRCNLREASIAENSRNVAKYCGRFPWKGISQDRNRFRATIHHNGNIHRLGRFNTAIEAALAYDVAARRLHGEFACLNFPDDQVVFHAPTLARETDFENNRDG